MLVKIQPGLWSNSMVGHKVHRICWQKNAWLFGVEPINAFWGSHLMLCPRAQRAFTDQKEEMWETDDTLPELAIATPSMHQTQDLPRFNNLKCKFPIPTSHAFNDSVLMSLSALGMTFLSWLLLFLTIEPKNSCLWILGGGARNRADERFSVLIDITLNECSWVICTILYCSCLPVAVPGSRNKPTTLP